MSSDNSHEPIDIKVDVHNELHSTNNDNNQLSELDTIESDDDDEYNTELITINKIEHKQLTTLEQLHELKQFIYLFVTLQSTLDPNTKFKQIWDWCIIVLVTYNAFMIPYYMSFDLSIAAVVSPLDLLCTVCMFCDIFLNFRTGYVDFNGNIVYDSKLIAKRYYQTGLIYDIMGTFPFDNFSVLFSKRYDTVFGSTFVYCLSYCTMIDLLSSL